jgi:hypothetical protein
VTIWKDPVIEMQRTKNHGLLHKNFEKEANACRQGMADYMLMFRKWPLEGQTPVTQRRQPGDYIGESPPTSQQWLTQFAEDETGEKVAMPRSDMSEKERRGYSIEVWQKYASPVWWDINQTNVLNYQIAKDSQDEKHICPLQLDVVARCVDLYTMEGETVFSPFAGIGSEGYEAVKMGRKFIGIELKRSYFEYAVRNLRDAETEANQMTLFDLLDQKKQHRSIA